MAYQPICIPLLICRTAAVGRLRCLANERPIKLITSTVYTYEFTMAEVQSKNQELSVA